MSNENIEMITETDILKTATAILDNLVSDPRMDATKFLKHIEEWCENTQTAIDCDVL